MLMICRSFRLQRQARGAGVAPAYTRQRRGEASSHTEMLDYRCRYVVAV